MTAFLDALRTRLAEAESEHVAVSDQIGALHGRLSELEAWISAGEVLLRVEEAQTKSLSPADGAPVGGERSPGQTEETGGMDLSGAARANEVTGESPEVVTSGSAPSGVAVSYSPLPSPSHEEPEQVSGTGVPQRPAEQIAPVHAQGEPAPASPAIPGLTQRQRDVYDFIKEHPGCKTSEVSDGVLMSASNVATTARAIEAAGLIRIERDTGRSYYYPTTGDAPATDTLTPEHREAAEVVESLLIPDEASSNGKTPALGAEDAGSTPAAPTKPVCACPEWWTAKVQRFDALVENESHHEACPMYKKGAHFFPIPSAMGDGVDVKCIWCNETKHFGPVLPGMPAPSNQAPLSEPATRLLRLIQDQPGITKKEAAQALGIDVASIDGRATTLAGRDLIERREVDPDGDGRYQIAYYPIEAAVGA